MKSFYLRWFFVAVAAILSDAAVPAQTIEGIITDAASKAPIIDATVTATESKQATSTKPVLSFQTAHTMMAPINPLI